MREAMLLALAPCAGNGSVPCGAVTSHSLNTTSLSIVSMYSPDHLPARRRRPAAGAPRSAQIVVRFTPDELATVAAAAERDGRAVGAWIGELAHRVARGEVDGVPVEWADVVRALLRAGLDERPHGEDLDFLIDIAMSHTRP